MGDRDSRLCNARSSRTGEPCGRYAILGGTVCPAHGGSAPQVREAARRRLLEAVDPVVQELVRIALGAEAESVRLSAIRDILDRVGVEAAQTVEVISDELLDAEIAYLEAQLADGPLA